MSTESLNGSNKRTSDTTTTIFNIFGKATITAAATKICKYCGWNMEEQDLDTLYFFHSDCWKQYRKDGLLVPMPEDFW
jgi:hypothetical protein